MNTKTCSSCKIEKPLTEFHRRGHRHQNICKVCRLASAKLPHQKREAKDNRANFAAIGERITALEPRLRMIASQYAGDPHEAEDIFQYVCEKLLHQASPEASDAMILTTAKRRAGDWVNAEKSYSFLVGDESEIGGTTEDEEDMDAFETFVGDVRSAEDIAIENEEIQAIEKLLDEMNSENRKVVKMLLNGYTQAEIAQKIGVTRQAINSRMISIGRKIKIA